METTEKYVRLLRKFKQTHASEYGITRMGIFGSVARGEHTETSDVDVVYESDTMRLWDVVGLKLDLEHLFGIPVDVVSMHKNMNANFKRRVEKEVIYV